MKSRGCLAAIALALASLTACGSGSDIEDADLDGALLSVEDLGSGFAVDDDEDEDDGEDDDPDWGCLLDFDEVAPSDSDDEDNDSEIAFSAKEDPGMPGIFQGVFAAEDVETAEEGMAEIADTLDGCDRVDSTDDKGNRWQFDVDFDRSAGARGADQQLNLTASGSLTSSLLELPISIAFTVVRVEEAVTLIAFFDMAEDIAEAHRDVTGAAVERLTAVVEDEALPEREPLLEDYPVGAALEGLVPPDTDV